MQKRSDNLNLEFTSKRNETLEDYTKIDIKTKFVFVLIVGILIFNLFFNHFCFDNTVLKNVQMEPFSEPIQERIKEPKSFMEKTPTGKVFITPIADYKIYGRVCAKHYRPARLQWASVYPYDITICFGNFKLKEVYRNIKFKMASTMTYYNYSYSAWNNHLSKYFNSQSDIHHAFTNNHIRPANNNVKRGIQKLKKSDVVYMEGYLIKFRHMKKDGTKEEGISSTSRNDREPDFSGDNGYGTCEQIYVTRIVSRHGDYR